jgi:hypothetical protein
MTTSVAGLVAGAVLLAAVSAHAQVARWINPQGGSFTDPANWDTGVVPDPNTAAQFDLAGTYEVTLTSNRNIGQLRLLAGHIRFVNSGQLIAAGMICQTGTFELVGGSFGLPLYSYLEVQSGTLINEAYFFPHGYVTVRGGASFINRAQMTWCSPLACGGLRFGGSGTVRFENASINASSFNPTGESEFINSSLFADPAGLDGNWIMRGGSIGSASPSWTSIAGTFLMSEGAIAGGTLVAIGGFGVITSGAGVESRATVGGNLTLRDGGYLGPVGQHQITGRLTIAAGGSCQSGAYCEGAAVLRMEPGSTGPTSYWFNSSNSTLEFLFDCADPAAPVHGS